MSRPQYSPQFSPQQRAIQKRARERQIQHDAIVIGAGLLFCIIGFSVFWSG